jgi:hypothetical protein
MVLECPVIRSHLSMQNRTIISRACSHSTVQASAWHGGRDSSVGVLRGMASQLTPCVYLLLCTTTG